MVHTYPSFLAKLIIASSEAAKEEQLSKIKREKKNL
jgi:hypothetical protein